MRLPADLRHSRPGLLLALLLSGALVFPAFAEGPADPAPAPAQAREVRGADLGGYLDDLLTATETVSTWKVAIEDVGADRRVREVRVWSDGTATWNGESQFRLKPSERVKVLKAFRDEGFCAMSDALAKEGAGERSTRDSDRRERSVTLSIGELTKTVKSVSAGGRTHPDPGTARALDALVEAVRRVCEGPAAKGGRPKDLDEGLAMVADGRLADVVLRVWVSRIHEAGGEGWRTQVEGRDVTTSVAKKDAKGWSSPVSVRLSDEEFRELVDSLVAARPGRLPKALRDEGRTELSLAVLGRSVGVQAGPLSRTEPKTQAGADEAYRAVVAAVRKLHQRALRGSEQP